MDLREMESVALQESNDKLLKELTKSGELDVDLLKKYIEEGKIDSESLKKLIESGVIDSKLLMDLIESGVIDSELLESLSSGSNKRTNVGGSNYVYNYDTPSNLATQNNGDMLTNLIFIESVNIMTKFASIQQQIGALQADINDAISKYQKELAEKKREEETPSV